MSPNLANENRLFEYKLALYSNKMKKKILSTEGASFYHIVCSLKHFVDLELLKAGCRSF